MRTLKSALAVALLGSTVAIPAFAGPYTASLEGCQSAISERLGLDAVPASYNLDKVKSKAKYRDLNFIVSAYDSANAVQGVKVSCRARQNGEVLALEFDESTLPVTVATH